MAPSEAKTHDGAVTIRVSRSVDRRMRDRRERGVLLVKGALRTGYALSIMALTLATACNGFRATTDVPVLIDSGADGDPGRPSGSVGGSSSSGGSGGGDMIIADSGDTGPRDSDPKADTTVDIATNADATVDVTRDADTTIDVAREADTDSFAADVGATVPSLCDGKPKKPLPYAILADFTQVGLIGPEVTNFTQILPADCNATTFPPIPPPSASRDGGDAGASQAGNDATAPPPACYEFLYNPSSVSGPCSNGQSSLCWAAAFFQSPGSTPGTGGGTGICVELGATNVTFSARASRDQARIKFGSIRPGVGSTEFFLNITTTWQTYAVSIPPGEPYNEYSTTGGVWCGFSVVVEPQDHIGDGAPGDVGTYVLIKDVVWSP